MRKGIGSIIILTLISIISAAQNRVLHTGINPIELILDGKTFEGGWGVMPELNPDVLETTASEIIFISDKDTLVINDLKEWESYGFIIVTAEGDSARVRVDRRAMNEYENINPALAKIAPSGKLTREQAIFDIDALIYGLSEVHPDMFSVCRQEDFFRAVNHAKESLPDSVTRVELYKKFAPIVAMIGDGHTSLDCPDDIFTKETKLFPVFVDVNADGTLTCYSSLDSIIAADSKILSINNISTDSIVNTMLPLISGERQHYKLSVLDAVFPALFHILYEADNYEVKYQPKGTNKIKTFTFPATAWTEIQKRCPANSQQRRYEKYSYTIDKEKNVGIMDFRSFSDMEGMQQFADSMFADLTKQNISNLIIDIRNNGGGNSGIGDILLRYISPKPFIQMEKILVKITPLTSKLIGNMSGSTQYIFHEIDSTQYIQPRSREEGHYEGNVYLLISNKTFSSATDFAWAFKEFEMGEVIGEETGGMNVSYGDLLEFTLPLSKLRSTISFKRFWLPGADENDIHGTIPHVKVASADALERALQIVGRKRNK